MVISVKIPNELSSRFDTVGGRKEIIQQYADSNTMFTGENSDGETVYLSVSKTGMVLKTEQKNGWVRVNYYDADAWKYRCLDLADSA